MAFLEVKNIKKSFGNTEVLKGIDFSLEKGQVLSIIGSSGSGKTTLLRCINFLEKPDEGEIIVNGETVMDDAAREGKLSEQELRRRRLHFGLVFQSFNLFPQYTAKGNLLLAAQLQAKERLKAQKLHKNKELVAAEMKAIEERADAILARMDLSDKAGHYPCELSGGQCQRVAIARALMLEPEILCFDEPTSALDPELTGEVLRVIRSLREENRTMIIVTHEMEFAKNVSDHVIFMADGVIEEEGTPEQVFDNPQSEKTRHFLSHDNK
ncbi:MAG: amino acid ABC transporter ATP-binding protein [Ruminococcaceae bacterium]|nr:amino acid ABC transporter ATP-binding protein [Oscillospiraceae bacterium]